MVQQLCIFLNLNSLNNYLGMVGEVGTHKIELGVLIKATPVISLLLNLSLKHHKLLDKLLRLLDNHLQDLIIMET